MPDDISGEGDPVLVLCHTIFHDAFRWQKDTDPKKVETWMRTRFVMNFIIEKKAESPKLDIAVTSKPAFDNFAEKVLEEGLPKDEYELIGVLKNSLLVVDETEVTDLGKDESVIAICDTLYSRSKYRPLLVTNASGKKEYAESFYEDSGIDLEEEGIPFRIVGVKEAKDILEENFPALCENVSERMDFNLD